MHDALVQLETSLRAERCLADVTEMVQAAIEKRRGQRIVAGVLLTTKQRQPHRFGRAWAAACLVLLVASAFAAAAALRLVRQHKSATRSQGNPHSSMAREQARESPQSLSLPRATAPSRNLIRRLWREDFDHGPSLAQGIVVRVRDAQGSTTLAAEGIVSQYAGSTLVTLRLGGVVWHDETRIAFDYKVSGGRSLTLLLWVPSSEQNFRFVFRNLPPDQWGHQEIRLRDLKQTRIETRLDQGAEVHSLSFSSRLGVGIQIDNVELDLAGP